VSYIYKLLSIYCYAAVGIDLWTSLLHGTYIPKTLYFCLGTEVWSEGHQLFNCDENLLSYFLRA